MEKLSSYSKILKWLLSYWGEFRFQALLNLLIGILFVGLNLSFVAATKLTIDIATGVNGVLDLWHAIFLLVGIMAAQILLALGNRWIKAVLGVKAQNRMQAKVFSRLLRCEWMSIRHFHSGDVLNRMLKDVGSLVDLLTEDFPSFVTTIVQFCGAFLFLYFMDETLALVVVVVMPFFLLISKLYIRKMRRLTHDVRESESRVQSLLQESLQHSLVIKTLERVDYMVQGLGEMHTRLRGRVVEKTYYSSISSTLMSLGFSVGYLLTFGWGVFQLKSGAITYGAMLAFIQLVGQIQTPVRNLSKYIPIFINSATACERLMELEALPLEEEMTETKSSQKELVKVSSLGLRLENVDYQYTPTSRAVLKNFSYDFFPGSVTVVTGETGAGKTTLIRLLMSLLKPMSGNISLVSKEGEVSPLAVQHRSCFAYIPQGNTLLSGTIRENLLLGDPDATEEMMFDVLKVAAADFVSTLPLGLDTPCTEQGGGLSEGQAQRICIARALLRRSPIVLLDECTSALDAATEEKVIERIIAHCKGQTLIFITHRPAVLRYANRQLHLSRTDLQKSL
ncbi:ABC transporter ATP-binding protein [Alloprevotella sp. OH1205_COT-284]|uniref:ABC transporter ATP-binding protein n=1 Tax=Alloprevotella sp. OH1205_COT-284 TaxID=2491043 RepID=UPI000F5DE068|nr:ABC transporter ATP-binding protein [Alloprevotella sp. OH1205_COT-284]RRD75672.1 ABC transporter ATP-binding protein [Alloprevotella sp. OH1205_COT-284]